MKGCVGMYRLLFIILLVLTACDSEEKSELKSKAAEYRYALVGGGRSDYLWILSRSGRIPDDIRKNYIEKAENLGYKVDNMIFFNN